MEKQLEGQFVEMLKQMNELYECMEQGFSRINEKLDGIDQKLNQVNIHLDGIDRHLK